MDLVSPQPFWPLKNGLLSVYPPLKSDVNCDVVVLGGGISGAFAAEALAGLGFNVVVLDKRDVGGGNTSARFLPQSRATQKFCNRDQSLRKRSGHVPPFVTVPSNQVLRMGLSGKDALRMSASSTHRTLAPSRFHPTQR